MTRAKLLLALAALHCDDATVTGKVTSVLANGGVDAYAECVATSTFPVFGANLYKWTASRLVDGSCLSTVWWSSTTSVSLVGRSQPGAAECRNDLIVNQTRTFRFEVSAGVMSITYFAEFPPGESDGFVDTIDVSASCTGFNLGAFE